MSRQNSSTPHLSSVQQDLLMAALNSNQSPPARQSNQRASTSSNNQRSGSQSLKDVMNGQGLFGSPDGSAPGSGQLDFDSDESPYLDFDLEGQDGFNFDDEGRMIGDLPDENSGIDLHDKRKSMPDDEEDDEGGGKRREGDDKSSKKPGRKPLTSEPTSKRKAQNRAAQRAFRERKEKHLKDLETKVEDLEKASESTSHENGLLKAQVERLQVELKEYRKRLSWVSQNPTGRASQTTTNGFGSQARNNNYNNDFQFEFPKFGDLPANNLFESSSAQKQQNNQGRASTLPTVTNQSIPGVLSRNSMSSGSPRHQNSMYGSNGNSPISHTFSASPVSQPQKQSNSVDGLNGLFSPSILEASRNSNAYTYFPQTTAASINQNTRGNFESPHNNAPILYASSSNTDSPASSSDSQNHVSSIGTSPEPSLNSPGNKVNNDYALNTINEEGNLAATFGGELSFCEKLALACGNATNPVPPIKAVSNGDLSGTAITPGFDPNGINWLAQQNGGIFDPELFGDYRESQDAVVSQDFGAFFNDAFPLPDLGSPEHPYNVLAPSPAPPKLDLLKQVEAAKDGEDEVVPGEDQAKLMTCNKIWDRLQSMEKFRNGEIDVDNLCSELRRKAKCSEGGAVVDVKDVETILGNAK